MRPMNRRTFIGTSIAASLAAAAKPAWAADTAHSAGRFAAAHSIDRVGLQLYTVRGAMKTGIQFGYHNHSFEFDPALSLGGKLPYDFLLAETDPKLVAMEMDLCWISVAGKDPLAYFEKYPGRFPLVHVKDWVKDASTPTAYQGAMGQSVKFGGRMADVGQGSINWKNLFAQSEKAGIQHYFVENDDPKSAFDDIKISYDYLAKLQF